MPRKFCPKCGRDTEEFHDNLCTDCFMENKSSLGKLPERMVARRCSACRKYLVVDKKFDSLNEAMEEDLRKLFNKPNISSVSFREDTSRGKLHVTIVSEFGGIKKEEEAKVNLSVKRIQCQYCAMKDSGYYQTVLQIRLPPDIQNSIIDDVVKRLSFLSHFDPQSFISKVEKTKKGGVDLYIGSKKAANDVVKALKKDLGVKIKFSKKLAGKSRGENVYRDTILITI